MMSLFLLYALADILKLLEWNRARESKYAGIIKHLQVERDYDADVDKCILAAERGSGSLFSCVHDARISLFVEAGYGSAYGKVPTCLKEWSWIGETFFHGCI